MLRISATTHPDPPGVPSSCAASTDDHIDPGQIARIEMREAAVTVISKESIISYLPPVIVRSRRGDAGYIVGSVHLEWSLPLGRHRSLSHAWAFESSSGCAFLMVVQVLSAASRQVDFCCEASVTIQPRARHCFKAIIAWHGVPAPSGGELPLCYRITSLRPACEAPVRQSAQRMALIDNRRQRLGMLCAMYFAQASRGAS